MIFATISLSKLDKNFISKKQKMFLHNYYLNDKKFEIIITLVMKEKSLETNLCSHLKT